MGNGKKPIVAIDGYSSTGKSTVAKMLAARLGYVYIDTGAMYRAFTLAAIREGMIRDGKVDEAGIRKLLQTVRIDFRRREGAGKFETYLNGACVEEQIRGMEVSGQVSLIAAVPAVRRLLTEQQREMGKTGGVVMDGRDIGSTVFPEAEVKFFMTASPRVRAIRRYEELAVKGEAVCLEEVEENIRKRDYLDEHRDESPLVRASDAILIDNSEMTIAEELELMSGIIREKCSGREGGDR